MNCKYCGNPIEENASTCVACGAAVEEAIQEVHEEQNVTVEQNVTAEQEKAEQPEMKTAEEPVVQQETVQPQQIPPQAAPVKRVRENVFTGLIGALIGASIGAAVIILLGRIGLVASISGFILAVCTLKGYQLLGRKIGIPGIIICLALIVITPYVADRIEWAMVIKKTYADMGVSLVDAFRVVPEFIKEGAIDKVSYIKSLGLIYLFAGFGAFGTLRSLFTGR